MDELREFVRSTGYDKACTLCYYTTDKIDNLLKVLYTLHFCVFQQCIVALLLLFYFSALRPRPLEAR